MMIFIIQNRAIDLSSVFHYYVLLQSSPILLYIVTVQPVSPRLTTTAVKSHNSDSLK